MKYSTSGMQTMCSVRTVKWSLLSFSASKIRKAIVGPALGIYIAVIRKQGIGNSHYPLITVLLYALNLCISHKPLHIIALTASSLNAVTAWLMDSIGREQE